MNSNVNSKAKNYQKLFKAQVIDYLVVRIFLESIQKNSSLS